MVTKRKKERERVFLFVCVCVCVCLSWTSTEENISRVDKPFSRYDFFLPIFIHKVYS